MIAEQLRSEQESKSAFRKLIGRTTPFFGRYQRLIRFSLAALSAAVLVILTLQALVSLAAGVDMRIYEQHLHDSDTHSAGTQLVGQSFKCDRANLSRIDVQVSDVASSLPPDGRVRLLAGEGVNGPLLYEAPLSSANYTKDGYLAVSFPPIAASEGAIYTFVLETPGRPLSSTFSVAYNSFDVLSSGQMYTSSGAQQGDLAIAFRYRYTLPILAGDITNALTQNAPLSIVWTLLLMLPGLALLSWLPTGMSIGQRLLAAPALTALTLPILFLANKVIHVRLNGLLLWILLAACAIALALRAVTIRDDGRWTIDDGQKSDAVSRQLSVVHRPSSIVHRLSSSDFAFWGLLAGIFLLTLISRLSSLRDLLSGVGLDAYHHTLIAKLFVDAGAIPTGYEPYAPLASFTYHYGFHALVATVAMLAGYTSTAEIMALTPQAGQIATALSVLSLTFFGWRALGNRWAGLGAGALAGVVGVIPAYYVNWSRFTQGLGLALLPVAWVLFLDAINYVKREDVKREANNHVSRFTFHVFTFQAATHQFASFILAVIASAGMALTHYRVLVMYAAFVALYLVFRLATLLRAPMPIRQALVPIGRGGLVAVLSLIVFFPWLLNLLQNFTVHWVGKAASTQGDYYSFERLGPDILDHPSIPIMVALAVVGLVVTLKRRNFLPILPAVAWGLLGLWSNPTLLPVRLPYSGYLDAITLTSAAWLPLVILGGYALAWFGGWILSWGDSLVGSGQQRKWQVGASLTLGVTALIIGAASGLSLSPISDPELFITPSDMQAMTWMQDHLPSNAYVLANPFTFPNSKSVLGSDAGVWAPMVTGLRVSVPPTPAYNERPANQTYFDQVRNIMKYAPLNGQKANWLALKSAGITYIYIGSRGGLLNVPDILKSNRVDEVYHKDAVYIFKLRVRE